MHMFLSKIDFTYRKMLLKYNFKYVDFKYLLYTNYNNLKT